MHFAAELGSQMLKRSRKLSGAAIQNTSRVTAAEVSVKHEGKHGYSAGMHHVCKAMLD